MTHSPFIECPEIRAKVIWGNIPNCRLTVHELRQEITTALRNFNSARMVQRWEQSGIAANEDWRKLRQTASAAQKLQELLDDPGVGAAIFGAAFREIGAGSGDADAPLFLFVDRARTKHLPRLVEALDTALEYPAPHKNRNTNMDNLVWELASIYVAATGEPLAYPTQNPETGEYSDAFIEFLDYFSEATDIVFEDTPPSDEAIRSRLRSLIDRGRISQRYAKSHLGQCDEASLVHSVTTTDEVTNDEERNDGPDHSSH